jgi:flagellar protein FliO/FliZ
MSFFEIIKVFLPLILIVGLLYMLLRFVKKSGFSINKRVSKISKNYNVQVVNTQMIMPKKFISIVKIKDKLLVLGVSENSINMLKEFDYELEPEEKTSAEPGETNNFLTILKRNLGIR